MYAWNLLESVCLYPRLTHPLAPLDNRLLEKAELLARFSEKLQPEPDDVTPATHQDPW